MHSTITPNDPNLISTQNSSSLLIASINIMLLCFLSETSDHHPSSPSPATTGHSAQRSVETLVVILAVIIIIVVLAGMLARLCGGRLLVGGGDHNTEGWVERKCRSCIDSGIPPPPPPLTANIAISQEVNK